MPTTHYPTHGHEYTCDTFSMESLDKFFASVLFDIESIQINLRYPKNADAAVNFPTPGVKGIRIPKTLRGTLYANPRGPYQGYLYIAWLVDKFEVKTALDFLAEYADLDDIGASVAVTSSMELY